MYKIEKGLERIPAMAKADDLLLEMKNEKNQKWKAMILQKLLKDVFKEEADKEEFIQTINELSCSKEYGNFGGSNITLSLKEE